jgi:nitrate/nitrite-specific signal transduction histidine kinase
VELRRELVLVTTVLVILNIVLAFGAIALLARMGPAIERILEENVFSIVAAEEILSAVAATGSAPATDEERRAVESALERAERNVTENEERPVLEQLRARLEPALSGGDQARREAVSDVQELIGINRRAMNRVDAEARRMGSAGAWAVVLLGILSFTLSLLAMGLLNRRILQPLEELHAVLEAVGRGDPLRRCHTGDAPIEVRQVTNGVNRLLDERLLASEPGEREALERRALKELLERHPNGAAVIDGDGSILHASRQMLAALAAPDGDRLRAAMTRDDNGLPQLEIVPLGNGAERLGLLTGADAR